MEPLEVADDLLAVQQWSQLLIAHHSTKKLLVMAAHTKTITSRTTKQNNKLSIVAYLGIFSAAQELMGKKYKGPFYITMLLICVYIRVGWIDGKLSAWTYFSGLKFIRVHFCNKLKVIEVKWNNLLTLKYQCFICLFSSLITQDFRSKTGNSKLSHPAKLHTRGNEQTTHACKHRQPQYSQNETDGSQILLLLV